MNIDDLTKRSEEASALLTLISNPSRLRIMCELHNGERSVGELEKIIGLSQSALSQHLAKLRAGGTVTTRREAQTIFYSIADGRVAKLLAAMHDIFCAPETKSEARKSRRSK